MHTKQKHHGSFFLRLTIFGFAVAVSVLTFWLLGYVIRDIDRIEGPSIQQMLDAGLPSELLDQQDELLQQQAELQHKVKSVEQQRRLLQTTIGDSQQTIKQLLELRRNSDQEKQTLGEDQQVAMTENLELFLSTQQQAQRFNAELSALNDELAAVQGQLVTSNDAIKVASKPIYDRHDELYRQHRWKLASYKLGVLIPIIVICVWLFVRQAGGTYSMLVYAVAGAVALRVMLVMHDHFPAQYFRYILIVLCLILSIGILVRMLRLLARPNADWLLRQYCEAYACFMCPICDFPIQRGPLKFAHWTRRSLKKHSLKSLPTSPVEIESAYTCPCCATELFASCDSCDGIRHTLLSACEKCGSTRTQIQALDDSTAE